MKRLIILSVLISSATTAFSYTAVYLTGKNEVFISTNQAPIPVDATFTPPDITTVTFNGSTQPVHVDNFPETQSVSGTVSVNNLPSMTTVTFNGAAQPVSATDLDIRNLSDSQDSVRVVGSTVAISSFTTSLPSGTNTIGKLAANDGVDIGDVTANASSSTFKAEVFASINSSVLMSSNTHAMTVKFAEIAASTIGTNVIVSTATGKIRVIRYGLVCGAATNVYWTSGGDDVIYGGSTNKMNFAANGGISEPYCPVGIMETNAAESLELNMSSTGPCSGGITYVEVP